MRFRSRLSTPLGYGTIHALSLVFAFGFLLYVNRNNWFNTDEWGPIAYRRVVGGDGYRGVFDPVGGAHWGTLTILSYRVLFSIFGLRSYIPYVVVMVAFQVLATHLLWRVALRAKVDPLVATFGAAAFGVLACGYSILTQAAGLYQTASVALGLAALLVVSDDGPLGRRDVAAAALALGSLMFFSGVGIPMLGALALRVLLTRGWRIAAAVVGAPAFALLLWLLLYLPKAGPNFYSDPFGELLRKTPELAWRGIIAAVDQTTNLPGVGAVIVVLTFGWAIRRVVLREAPWPLLVAITAGGLAYLPLIAFGRSGLGVEAATASRYLYTIVAFMLPLLLAAAASQLASSSVRIGVIALLGIALMGVQVTQLNRVAGDRATVEQDARRAVLATAEIMREGKPVSDAFRELAPIIPLNAERVLAFSDAGDLPDGPAPSPVDLLDARLFLQIAASERPLLKPYAAVPKVRVSAPGASVEQDADCQIVRAGPQRSLALMRPQTTGTFAFTADRRSMASIALIDQDPPARTQRRRLGLRVRERFLNIGTTEADVVLTLRPEVTVRLCPVPG
jgi:hypothetical protein